MASSKRENFKGGLVLLQKVQGLFLLALLLDAIMVYGLISYYGCLSLIDTVFIIVQLVMFLAHLGYGIPVILYGRIAGKRFRNMYPPVPKVEVFKNTERQNEEDFFEVAETQKQTEVIASDTPKKETVLQDTDEIIEYDDEGYIGAWRPQKNDTDISEEKEREEEVKTKECPFCGTLNGINNEVCDFCGADIPE